MDKNRELALAYRMILNNVELDDYNAMLLQNNNINIQGLKYYLNKLKSYQNGNDQSITINENDFLDEMFGEHSLDKIRILNENNNSLNSNNEKAKVNTLTNGKKQILVNDEAAFSEIYMFGFLVLLFQVLFLIISYIIFSK